MVDSRLLINGRAWNIGLRTGHLAAMGILLGGHAFNVDRSDLVPVLWLCVGTGIALAALEAGLSLVWFHQCRGLMTIAKIGILLAVPLFWPYRLGFLLVAVILGSVGSHMPARFRYYSVLRREVIRCGTGVGFSRLEDDSERADPSNDEGPDR